MGNVVSISGHLDVSESLRVLADEIDNGEHAGERVTIILDGESVYCAGQFPDSEAGFRAVFDCQMGLHLMMETSLYGDEDE